jgi:hypothetical protein
MTDHSTRRDWMLAATTFAAATAAAHAAKVQETTSDHRLKVGKGLRDLSDETLTFFKQIGIEHVTMPTRLNLTRRKRGPVPSTDRGPRNDGLLRPWDSDDLKRIKDYLAERGLTAGMVHLGRT